jgi:hypothetical protein
MPREILLRLKKLFGEDSSSVSQADKKKRFSLSVVVGATTWEGSDATGYLTINTITQINLTVCKYNVKIFRWGC